MMATAVASDLKDLVDTAISAGSFETLVTAVKAAGLVSVLKSEGPFTVFAPTEEAFAKVPRETLKSLLRPENTEQLKAVLTYHVAPGKLMSADVLKQKELKTVQGQSAEIRLENGQPMIDAARIVKTDVVCSNGVIHVIDAVILPK